MTDDHGGAAATHADVGALPHAGVLVAGQELPAPTAPVFDPACRTEVVGHVALGDASHVDRAVTAAGAAFPGWSTRPVAERAQYLRDAAAHLRADLDAESWARVLTRENGKVLWESRAELTRAPNILDYYASLADDFEDAARVDARGKVIVGRRPMGVAAAIVPWNVPVSLGLQMIAPALLAGNTVVVKPALEVPLAFGAVLAKLMETLPVGTLNSVPGEGVAAGEPLVTHPDVRKIAFTGSVPTGRRILALAADRIKRVTLELGGNDPALVLEDARVDDKLFEELVKGVYTSTGQVCYNVKRIYVHQSLYDVFVEGFCEHVDRLRVGPGLDERSDFGPLNSERQYAKVAGLLDDASRQGGDVRVLGGKVDPAGWDDGNFMLPAVVTGARADAPIVAEEQFGPVVPVLAVDSDDAAIDAANASEYGLAASLWTEDVERAERLARRIEAGSVFINVHRVGASAIDMPFGGFKKSGLGRSHGAIAVEENTEVQVTIQRKDM
jgi:aldehyde dehydrogenase